MEKKNQLKYEEALKLSPFEMNTRYNSFPWMMVIHFLLIILSTFQVVSLIGTKTTITRAQERAIANLFIGQIENPDPDPPKVVYLYSASEIRSKVRDLLDNYYNIEEKSLEIIELPKSLTSVMRVQYLENKETEDISYFVFPNDTSSFPNIPRYQSYLLDNSTLGPFDFPDDKVKVFMNSIVNFNLNFSYLTYIPKYKTSNLDCYFYNIHSVFNFIERSHLRMSLNIERKPCYGSEIRNTLNPVYAFMKDLRWMNFLVIVLATISTIISWNEISDYGEKLSRTKKSYKEKKLKKNENDLVTRSEDSDYYNPVFDPLLEEDEEDSSNNNKKESTKEMSKGILKHGGVSHKHSSKKKLEFSWWPVACMIGNVCQVFGSFLGLISGDITQSQLFLIGLGTTICYCGLGRYIEYNPDFSAIYSTLKSSLPMVLRYLLGVMPIFFGFIFLGVCLFGKSDRFRDTSSTMMTLFALMHGDSIFDVLMDLSSFNFFIGQAYVYTFCTLFIVIVLNVFISIIEESYIVNKLQNKTHWVNDYLKLDAQHVIWKDKKGGAEEKPDDRSIVKRHTMGASSFNVKKYQSSTNVMPTGYNFGPHTHAFHGLGLGMQRKKSNKGSFQELNILNYSIEKKRGSNVQSFERENILSSSHQLTSFGLKPAKETIIDEKTKLGYDKVIENHFNSIEKSLDEILKLSKDVKKKNQSLYDDLRITVLDHIEEIESKNKSLKQIYGT